MIKINLMFLIIILLIAVLSSLVRPSFGFIHVHESISKKVNKKIKKRRTNFCVAYLNIAQVNCTAGQSVCADLSQCIPSNFLCDGRVDCEDGSDEKVKKLYCCSY